MEINLFLLTNEVVFLGPEQPPSIVLISQSDAQRQNLSSPWKKKDDWGVFAEISVQVWVLFSDVFW